MKITKKKLRKIIREGLLKEMSGYDNIEDMNTAVMDAIFQEPMSEKELIRVATAAAPDAAAVEPAAPAPLAPAPPPEAEL